MITLPGGPLASAVLALLALPCLALPSLYEVEPNNTPAEANPIAGAVILIGEMPGGDQDGFRWTVSDVDAQKRWNFELQGIPGQLTIVEVIRVDYADNGVDVDGTERMFKMGTRDGSLPSVHRDMIFEPGEYILGVAGAGGGGGIYRPPVDSIKFDELGKAPPPEEAAAGGYRLSISQGSPLLLEQKPRERSSRDSAYKLRPDRENAAFLSSPETWYQLEIGGDRTSRRWDIDGQVPVGRSVQASLYGSDGNRLAETRSDDKGRFSFPDLGLEVGSYQVGIKGDGGAFIRAVTARTAGQRIAGEEAEPNDEWKLANRADLSQPLRGRMGKKGETDYFLFAVDESTADQVLSLKLETAAEHQLTLCLLDESGKRVQCRNGKETVALVDLVLTPGSWGLEVSRGPEAAEYRVSLTPEGAIQAGTEAEPNDAIEYASAVPANNRTKGRFSGRQEDDYYKFLVTEEPQLWRFQVIGDEVHELAYHDASGHQSQVYRIPRGQRRVRLDNVYLLPGIHHVRVTGREGGTYTLLARPLGPPDPDGELEPNDDTSRMQPLRFGQSRKGALHDKQDSDNYRFYLSNWDHIRLSIQPPVDGKIMARLYWDGDNFREFNRPVAGQRVDLDGLFPPGDYRLSLYASEPSDAEYRVSLERRERFSCATDCEPNDNADFASPFPASHIIEGRANEWRDTDWFALPVFEQDTEISLASEGKRQLSVIDRSYGAKTLVSWDADASAWRGTIPAGLQAYVKLPAWGDEPYRFEVSFTPEWAPATAGTAVPVDASLELESTVVGAYRPYGQRVTGLLRLHNGTAGPQQLNLDSATSDYRWLVELDSDELTLEAGSSVDIPVTVLVPTDAWADWPVRVSVRARGEGGSQAQAYIDLRGDREVAPLDPVRGWTLPEPLRGGFNVARESLGGRWAGEPDDGVGSGFPMLFDGMAVEDQGVTLRGGNTPASTDVIVDLAGEQPVDVVGLALNSLSGARSGRFLRNLDFALSLDGKNFTPVLRGELLPVRTEQAFVLEQPTPARFARLQLKEGFDGSAKSGVSLGEFKVIARPGLDITGGEGFNLADPLHGGHVVWSKPAISAAGWDGQVLTIKEEKPAVRPRPGESMEFVVGFHHDRAAQIQRLDWRQSADARAERRVREVTVSVSTDSPLGPWQPVAKWLLAAGGGSDSLVLETPVWARFVRLAAAPEDEQKWRAWPDTLEIRERPTDDEYRSILSEWGHASQAAIYEALQPLELDPPFKPAGHDSRETAATLAFGVRAGGQVVLGKHEHWYRMSVPADQNTVQLDVGGDPTVRTVVQLENEAGDSIPLRKVTQESTPALHRFEAVVEPGGDLFLKVEEPPRNVVFLWDTSASVGAYLPVIYNSLMAYAEDLVPGRDAANLLPFGGDLLLQDWYGDPYIMQTILNDYPRKENSSEAEGTLDTAARGLAPRAGTKAIVMVTDAATSRYAPMWDQMHRVQPRIFNLGVGSQGAFGRNPALEQDLLQDWSRVNGGNYSYLLSAGEMEVAFDRVATLLRRPAGYTVEVSSSYRKAPGPGSLAVVAGDKASIAGGAVELILDASGSMLKRLDGKRRIAIAREVLTETVNNHIPAGTPVALRVFGHREPNSCRTDLEIPLAPLDPARASRTIEGINAMNLARTPLADSLAKVESDLKKARGRKIVILVTDGEETCDGNPEEVIAGLQDNGFEITLNIVGFAIDDEALENQFRHWASLGGGRFFASDSQEGLRESLAEALQVPYTVYDTTGAVAGEGLVGGEPLRLIQGQYRVVVKSSPPRTFETVDISGEKHTELKLD